MDIELVTSSPKLESLCLEENPLTREAEANAESEAAANAGITIREAERHSMDFPSFFHPMHSVFYLQIVYDFGQGGSK